MTTTTPPSVPPFLLRGLARVIDLGVQLAILEAAFRCSAWLPAEGLVHLGDDLLFGLDLVVGLSALLTYTAVAEWRGGATLGKLLTGLRSVKEAPLGAPLDLRAAVIRNLGFLVDALLLGLVAYSAMARSEQRQRLGDRWAGTVVVWRTDATGPPRWWGVPVAVVLALAWVLASYAVAR